jgi:hypothetical protein
LPRAAHVRCWSALTLHWRVAASHDTTCHPTPLPSIRCLTARLRVPTLGAAVRSQRVWITPCQPRSGGTPCCRSKASSRLWKVPVYHRPSPPPRYWVAAARSILAPLFKLIRFSRCRQFKTPAVASFAWSLPHAWGGTIINGFIAEVQVNIPSLIARHPIKHRPRAKMRLPPTADGLPRHSGSVAAQCKDRVSNLEVQAQNVLMHKWLVSNANRSLDAEALRFYNDIYRSPLGPLSAALSACSSRPTARLPWLKRWTSSLDGRCSRADSTK